MKFRMALTTGALGLALATGAWAQPQDLTGTVSHVDPAGRIVHFTDGRIAHLDQGATLWVDGRPITFDAVRPGMTVVVRSADAGAVRSGPAAAAPGAVTVHPGSRLVENHPPIDASGTIARIDEKNGIVTFQDGRVMKLARGAYVWEAKRLEDVERGDHVFIQNAQPLAFDVPAGAVTAQGRQIMGTVTRVDANKARIVLDDGRIVNIRPTTKMRMGNQTVALNDLQPGDQLVIWVQDPATGSTSASPATQPRATATPPGGTATPERSEAASALPHEAVTGFAAGSLDASEVLIMRRPQSP